MNELKRTLPAYPLFVKDPNYSFWMCDEKFAENDAQVWWGEKKKIYGFLKTGGKTYCFLGNSADFAGAGVIKAEQTGLSVSAFSTDCEFRCGEVTLKVKFVSPLPLNDLEILSLPVCYAEYEIIGGEAEVSLAVNQNVCYNVAWNTSGFDVRGGVVPQGAFKSAWFGRASQRPLSNTGDLISADWGYFYLSGEKAYYTDDAGLCGYLTVCSSASEVRGENRYVVAANQAAKGVILLGFDERLSIDYFGSVRKGYYLENHTIFQALEQVWNTYGEIDGKLLAFEKDLFDRAEKFGEEYKNVLIASLRQSIAAHKLVRDEEGNVLWLSKEHGSGGFIATVDVSYPSIPLYLLYNPELVKGMVRPIAKFARMPVWEYDFAPHDAGMYPFCGGQCYGAAEEYWLRAYDYNKYGVQYPLFELPAGTDCFIFEKQMPVEECANLLVMICATYKRDGDIAFFKENADLCEKWVEYLVKYGLKPENQLCTDDFAGHLKNNVNLAVKATVGIGAYSELLKADGREEEAKKYMTIAQDFAKEISAFADGKTHLPLTWDTDESTFSLKYNFAFDKILGLNLFDQKLLEKETDAYIAKANRFGTPLDSRKGYTKSDWICWAASLSDDMDKKRKMIAPIDEFLRNSPDRVPYGDWFETEDGKWIIFRGRSVQGGCFILLL